MNLAPIILFVYNRPWHTRQTVETLQRNELAEQSELFIYSDGAKNKDARKSVDEVREYIDKIDGFKKVTVIKREKNWGLANSIIDGVTKIVNEYGKIIVLEDDLVTSPYFLKFMNEALEFYSDDNRIFSISGYTYAYDTKIEHDDVFLFYGASSWGWSTWVDRWNKIDFEVKDYQELLTNKAKQKKFNRGGDFLFDMLKAQMKGQIDSWAIRFSYSHSKNNALCLFPSKSMVQNIGHDNSGTHCGASDRWNVNLYTNYLPKIKNIMLNDEIVSSVQKGLNKTYLEKIKRLIRKIIK
jgi:hypothetical protein